MRIPTVALVLAALAAAPRAQDANQLLTVQVVDQATGLPRPGVPVHRVPRHARFDHRVRADGWIVPAHEQVERLRAAMTARSDPEGIARFDLPATTRDHRFFTGAQFVHGPAELQADGSWKIAVTMLAPFSVAVRDATGAALVDFSVALEAGREVVSVAVTDANGLAAFGVPEATTARLVVVPLGWIGPREGFPSVAQMLPRRRPTLTVPPWGVLRVRTLRRGAPATAVGTSAMLYAPSSAFAHAGTSDLATHGVELGPVALGQKLQGNARSGRRTESFRLAGPSRAGEVVVFDLELEPPRPQVRFRLTGTGRAAVGAGRVAVMALSADRALGCTAQVGADGTVRPEFGPDGLPAARLEWLFVDAAVEAEGLPPRVWSGAVRVGATLEPGARDLGAVELVAFPPALRGRVVDQHGKPIEGAYVSVRPAEGGVPWSHGYTLRTRRDGSFRLLAPVFRGPDGEPVGAQAVAEVVRRRSAPSAVTAPGGAVELVVAGVSAEEAVASGSVRAVVTGLPAGLAHRFRAELRADDGFHRRQPLRVDQEHVVAEFGALAPGRYRLRLATLPGDALADLADLEVDGRGACADPRLARVDVAARLVVSALTAVDAAGVPVAGAQVQSADGRWALGETDARGGVLLARAAPASGDVVVVAAGMRSARLSVPGGASRVVLEAASTFTVEVQGLPADLPRDLLEVWLVPVERDRRGWRERAPLRAGDRAAVVLPLPGRYQVGLHVTREHATGLASARVAWRPEPYAVPVETAPCATSITLDAAAVARLREQLAKD